MINRYEFGLIVIEGKSYNHDVAAFWDGNVSRWQRAESHVINAEDVQVAINKNPEIIVIGTGEEGIAKVTEEATKEIISKGINLVIEKTKAASEVFNVNAAQGKKAAGLFHLTC